MLKKFLPRQMGFFTLFQKTAETLVNATIQFHSMLNDLQNLHHYVSAIAIYEHEADGIAHTTFELLHKTFITPFDREDIHQLTSYLDDIIDQINRSAQRFPFYQLHVVTPEMVTLAELGVQAAQLLQKAIQQLDSLKKSADILNLCAQIDKIESEAHRVMLAGEAKLFLEESDFKQFIKMKEIYANSKSVINGCQDAANIVKGIVLEYS